MKVSDAIITRRSMRAFKPQPPPRADLEWMIATASRAASNGNLQPWFLYVATGAARDRLCRAILDGIESNEPDTREYDVYPRVFPELYDRRRKTVGKQLYTILGVPRGDEAGMARQFRKNYEFFDAPVGMMLCVDRDMGDGQWLDLGSFLTSLMLLAREKGLHTCPQAAFGRYQHIVRRELGIPQQQIVVCGLAVGYADENDVPNNLYTERAPPTEWARWVE